MMIRSLDQVTEFPLCWPEIKPREARRIGSPFSATLAKAHKEIEAEMSRWRARGFVLSMAPAYRQGNVDPGVALWWNMPLKKGQTVPDLRVIACDKYSAREANAHAIALTLTGLRAFERYGTYTLEQAAEGARPALPPPETPEAPPWWQVLGADRTWPLAAVELAYRTKSEKAHPDRGGSAEDMAALNAAISEARKEKRA